MTPLKNYFNQCPICLDDKEILTFESKKDTWSTDQMDAYAPPCGHGIHKKCLKMMIKCLNKKSSCPRCRNKNFVTEDLFKDIQVKRRNKKLHYVARNTAIFCITLFTLWEIANYPFTPPH